MNVSGVTSSYTTSSVASQTKDSSNEIDMNFFINMLVTQMKNQNPLSPTDNSDFINQVAQFTTLEALQSLNTSFTESKAFSLLGKYVTTTSNEQGDSSSAVAGVVDSVTISGGEIFLNIGDQAVSLEQVRKVDNRE